MDALNVERHHTDYSISFAEAQPRYKGPMGLAAAKDEDQEALDQRWPKIDPAILAICNIAHFKIC